MAKVELKGIGKVYEGNVRAVTNANITINDKEFVVFVGPSGCGKTTTLRMIAGLEDITEGEIYIDSKLVNDVPPKDRDIAMVFQNYALYPHMTVYENMALDHIEDFVRRGVLDRKGMLRQAEELIAQFQIKAKPRDRVRTLSGGNLQKVLLARVLSRSPRLIIVPQPTRGLDIGATDYIRQQLLEQRQRGVAVLLVSADLEEVIALSDRVAVMFRGEIMGIVPGEAAYLEAIGRMMLGEKQGQ